MSQQRNSAKFSSCLLVVFLMLIVPLAQANDNAPFQGNHFALYVDTVTATFDLNDPPEPLDTVVFSRDVYAVDLSDPGNPLPTGPVIGSNMVQCTVAGPAGLLCQGTVSLFGIGDLIISGPFVFQNPDEVAVTGGTGRFTNARGQMTALEINADADQVYWFDLSGRRY
ncbi:MAG TPA: hypothetical protein VKN35_01525 [Xanthomonadales bacterium]|nr:hypothetical protein [Xanthomonadales bacterium]